MANKTQTWQNVTPAQYTALESDVKTATGLAISGDHGTAEYKGVQVAWEYANPSLGITVLSAPPFCTGMAEKKIAAAVNKALERA